jgi:two-component sensor histidine kinase/CheY-like chemotaxis protein
VSASVHVLYLDDDAALAQLMRRALAPRGVEIVPVENPDRALEMLKSTAYDLVALDHDLGSTTGLQMLPLIRSIEGAPPVIYVTGSDDARIAVAALKAGAVDYVWKDVEGHYRELFAEAVKSALMQENLRRAKESAERQMREAKERAETLLGEVNHRVANSLALVAGLAHMQASTIADETSKRVLREMQIRIQAIAGIHRRLYTSQDVRFVEMDAYISGLARDLSAAINSSDHPIRVDIETDISVATDKAVSVGVVITELITNALKYAYPNDADGEIRVRLTRKAGGRLLLAVEDDGVGWAGVGQAKGTGVGSRVIDAMATNLQSAVSYDRVQKGTRVTIEFAA